jgi:hypothetical protein
VARSLSGHTIRLPDVFLTWQTWHLLHSSARSLASPSDCQAGAGVAGVAFHAPGTGCAQGGAQLSGQPMRLPGQHSGVGGMVVLRSSEDAHAQAIGHCIRLPGCVSGVACVALVVRRSLWPAVRLPGRVLGEGGVELPARLTRWAHGGAQVLSVRPTARPALWRGRRGAPCPLEGMRMRKSLASPFDREVMSQAWQAWHSQRDLTGCSQGGAQVFVQSARLPAQQSGHATQVSGQCA